MSVVIKGLELPKSCFECPCIMNIFFCKACGGKLITDRETTTFTKDAITIRKPKWCPMIDLEDYVKEDQT